VARSTALRLEDMLEAMDRVQAAVERCKEFEQFEKDRDSQLIVERGLEIVSEASRHLPDALKQRHSNIPWKDIKNIGNILRHEYERSSKAILWETAQVHVLDLKAVCQAELQREVEREKAKELKIDTTPSLGSD